MKGVNEMEEDEQLIAPQEILATEKISDNEVDSNIRQRLAANISAYRKERKMSRAELAEKLNVSEAAIGQYEREERTPQVEILCKLSDFFDVPIDTLIGHGVNDYNIVEEYRFQQAREFVQTLGFSVRETPEGNLLLFKSPTLNPHLAETGNRIFAIDNYDDLKVSFKNRSAFLLFVESLVLRFFTATDADIVLEKTIRRLLKHEEFLPSLKIEINSYEYRGSSTPF